MPSPDGFRRKITNLDAVSHSLHGSTGYVPLCRFYSRPTDSTRGHLFGSAGVELVPDGERPPDDRLRAAVRTTCAATDHGLH